MDDSFLAIEAVHSLIEYNDQMCEVPEDLQSILNDTSLFNNSSDITTKEILKRYGDIGTNGGAKHQVETTQSPLSRSKEGSGRALAPVVTRVDTDTSQATAWQKESSVRHVQEQPSLPYQGNSSNQNTPQQQWQGDLENPSTHPQRERERAGTPDSQSENANAPRGWRNSAWGPRQQQNGSVGVTGAN